MAHVTSTTPDARWAVDLLRSMASRGAETAFTDGVATRSHAESHARAVALAHEDVNSTLGTLLKYQDDIARSELA